MVNRKDTYYHKAKNAGFRSRAAYKIIELQEKFGIFHEGDIVLELGAAPGGWSQAITEMTGATVVAMDTSRMDPVDNVVFIKGNIHDENAMQKVEEALRDLGADHFDAVVSDAMTKTSGDRNIDHSSSYLLCRKVMEIADRFLVEGGSVVVKQFQGDLTKQFFDEWSPKYRFRKQTSTTATRHGSREVYFIFANKKKASVIRQ